jgi:uncharacterized protein YbjT (DUF2867 family)
VQVFAGARNLVSAKEKFRDYKDLEYVQFDFEQPGTFESAFRNIDTVFLLRPPQISDVNKYFRPLVSVLKEKQVGQIVFLSVQGAEKSKVIPHHKIENLIVEYGLDHVFLRPAYFMQNLTTTLLPDIRSKQKIILPAGKGKFNWIDIENIAEIAALALTRFSDYKNQSIELTGYENRDFQEVVDLINAETGAQIEYQRVNPLKFYRIKKQQGMARGMIMVMIMLHFLPRIMKAPNISKSYELLTGKPPHTLRDFIRREKAGFVHQGNSEKQF